MTLETKKLSEKNKMLEQPNVDMQNLLDYKTSM